MADATPFAELKTTRPLALMRAFHHWYGVDNNQRILHYWKGDFYRFEGKIYRRLDLDSIRAEIYRFLINCTRNGILFRPEPGHINAVETMLACECQCDRPEMPCWLQPHRPAPADTIAYRNGLLDLSEVKPGENLPLLTNSNAAWFSTNLLPYDYEPSATCPVWCAFLESTLIREGRIDYTAIAMLQEWFGYCMTFDLSHQKLLLLVGAPGSGKGTIIRALRCVIGEENTASPSFQTLANEFGLHSLLGKRIACIPDAHLERGNALTVLDRILQISGNDSVAINRKGQTILPDCKLGVRFTIGCNEPPDLPDASAAIVRRLLVIQFKEDFTGREDRLLDDKIAAEVQGIAKWALVGLMRLRVKNNFTSGEHDSQIRREFTLASSPIHVFADEMLEFSTQSSATADELFAAWEPWAKKNGCMQWSKMGLMKKLNAAFPRLERRQKDRKWSYFGVTIRNDPPAWM